ncbi:GMC family oxidoreductase N-terminal domain-containing protein [Enterobacter cloacae subsp. cloacae]|nr:GMC family oxidoreductase N-terminal domain-containing protein [Enterobacter cloacae subsp. cloacae]
MLYSGNIIAANGDQRYEWGYYASPVSQPDPVYTPRGKTLGGSSAINAAVSPGAPRFRTSRQKGLRAGNMRMCCYYKKMEPTLWVRINIMVVKVHFRSIR